ncbi:MAG: hypothetical protein DMF77_13305 [Acidobacteria bacterium]|nr:MAG: hypothetical protein DMF77_13305 [Acidobacteriota bacterium]
MGAVAGFMLRDLAVDTLASFWLPWAVLGAVVFGRLRTLLGAFTMAVLAIWLAVAFTPLVARLARPLVRRDAVVAADAVLVLGSRLQSDGEPSATALSRLVHGLELTREPGARLVVTEKVPPPAAYAALASQLARRLGLTPEVIAVGPARRTRDEAVEAAALCRRRGWHRLLVVTSPTHSRRACDAVEHLGVAVSCSPAAETEFDLETFDRPSDRFIAFRSVLHEWAGIWYYRYKGWA